MQMAWWLGGVQRIDVDTLFKMQTILGIKVLNVDFIPEPTSVYIEPPFEDDVRSMLLYLKEFALLYGHKWQTAEEVMTGYNEYAAKIKELLKPKDAPTDLDIVTMILGELRIYQKKNNGEKLDFNSSCEDIINFLFRKESSFINKNSKKDESKR